MQADILLKDASLKQIVAEYHRRGWYSKEVPVAIGCCGKGRRLTLTYNPWDINKND